MFNSMQFNLDLCEVEQPKVAFDMSSILGRA